MQNLVAQLRLPDAHRTLRGKVFSTVGADGLSTRTVKSCDEFTALLRDQFGLDVPEVATLWPRIEQRHEDARNQLRLRPGDSRARLS